VCWVVWWLVVVVCGVVVVGEVCRAEEVQGVHAGPWCRTYHGAVFLYGFTPWL
jgi:hypothetical protein